MFIVPCDSGTFWNSTSNQCDPCPVDTYQPFKNMTLCLPCPPGSYAPSPGALLCKGKCDNYSNAVAIYRSSIVVDLIWGYFISINVYFCVSVCEFLTPQVTMK